MMDNTNITSEALQNCTKNNEKQQIHVAREPLTQRGENIYTGRTGVY